MKTLTLHLNMMLTALFLTCGCTMHQTASTNNPTTSLNTSTVKTLDVKQYMGKWYEIARFDHRFERGMDNVMTTYTLLPNGKIEVVNEGYKKGKRSISRGKAYVPDATYHPAQLRVSFFLWFYSDYYILELDDVKYMYAVVGSSSNDYLWILYRIPEMPHELLTTLLQRIEQRGYDVTKLIMVKHDTTNQ